MKRLIWQMIVLTLVCLLGTQGTVLANGEIEENHILDPARTWVVLMEKNHYPFGFSPLDVGFINTARLKETVIQLGVPESQIFIKQDEVDRDTVEESIRWLKSNSTAGDTLIMLIAAHGDWIGREMKWNLWFHDLWKGLSDRQRVLIIDSCESGQYVSRLWNDTNGIAISVTSSTELAWWGILEEGLPIIGDIWLYYFRKAIFDPASDQNGDGMISVEEAFAATTFPNQQYMKEKVFAVKEFARSFRDAGMNIDRPYPNPEMYDTLSGELILYELPK